MRNTYEFDQQPEWQHDFDDSFSDEGKNKRLKQRRIEQRSNNKRSPIEAFSEEHFSSESRRR